jgi:hypothetical protein
MPNGRRGDNPLSDILVYGESVYTPELDTLIREINGLDDQALADPEVQELIFDAQEDGGARLRLSNRLNELKSVLHRELRDWDFDIRPETELLVVTVEDLGLASGTVKEDIDVLLLTVRLPDGRIAVPVFTDEDELLAWRPTGGFFIGMRAAEIFRLAFAGEADVVIVNPANPQLKIYSRTN